MRKFRISVLVAGVVAAIVAGSALSAAPYKAKPKPKAAAAAAHKPKPKPKATAGAIAFTGSFSGQASTKVDGSNAAISANGNGTGTLIGAATITGTGNADASQQPCPPFGGTGSITGAKGTIQFSVVSGSKGCGDDGGHNFTLVGYLQVTKATGAVANAKGQLRLTGLYNRDAGTFQIKLTGSLKK